MSDRDKHAARVYLAQARAFRNHAAFHAVLLTWAARARRRASGERLLNQQAHAQGELFDVDAVRASKRALFRGKS